MDRDTLKLLIRKADLEAEAEKLEDEVVRLAAAAADSREYVSAKARLENVRLKIEALVRQLDPSQTIDIINEAIDKAKSQHATQIAAERAAFEDRMRAVAKERRRLLDVPLKHPADFCLLLEKTGNPLARFEAGLGDSDPMALYLGWHRDDHVPDVPWKIIRDLPKSARALWTDLEIAERERSPLLTIKERRVAATQAALSSGVNVFSEDGSSHLGHLQARVVVCSFVPPGEAVSSTLSRSTSVPPSVTRARGAAADASRASGAEQQQQQSAWGASPRAASRAFSGSSDSAFDSKQTTQEEEEDATASPASVASDAPEVEASREGVTMHALQPARTKATASALASPIGRAVITAELDAEPSVSASGAAGAPSPAGLRSPPLVLPGVQSFSAVPSSGAPTTGGNSLGGTLGMQSQASGSIDADFYASRTTASQSGAAHLNPGELTHRSVLAGAAFSSFVHTAPMSDILRTTRSLARTGISLDTHSRLEVPDVLSASMTADQRSKPLHPSYQMKTTIEHEKRFETRVKGNKEGTFSEPDPVAARTTSERRLAAKLLIMDRNTYNPLKDGKSAWTTKNTDLTGGALGFGRFASDGEFLRDSDNAKAAAIESRFWSQAAGADGGAGIAGARMSPSTLMRSPRSRAKSPRKSPGQRSRGKASAGAGGGAALLAQGSRESL